MKLNLLVVAVVFYALQSVAQNDITAVPNRPTVSTIAQPVQTGVLETEWGVDATSSHQDVNGLLKFGVSTNLELRFANDPITADSGTHGFGDVLAGFKYRLTTDHDNQPSIAVMYMFKAPTAGNVLGSGYADQVFTLLVSKDLGKHHFDYNFIANVLGMQAGLDHDFVHALAWSHPLRGSWGVNGELSGVTPSSSGLPGSAQFILAGTYTARPRLVFDFGVMGRLTGPIPHAMFMAGVTYSIADLYRTRGRAKEEIELPLTSSRCLAASHN